MEFHTLTRRELQALCKKNKIPANITNAGMIEALEALDMVEGIDELIQPSQSETVKSSIDSHEGGLEVTSPSVPPTGGRTTRRRNVMKEELEVVTTTRRTTRRTAAKASHVDIPETPAMMSQTSSRKGQMASACRKMDSQFNECVEEEEKKDVSMTPAPLGVTSRKGRKEVSTVQKVYSTRRSVRLAEKNVDLFNVERNEGSELVNNVVLSEDGGHHENEESELVTYELLGKDGEKEESEESELVNNVVLSKDGENHENKESELVTNELLGKDGENEESEESELVTNELLDIENQEVNLEKDNEPSGITGGVDAIISVENFEKKEKSEVVSAEVLEGESCIGYAEEAELDEEISDNGEFDGDENSIEPEKSEVVPAEVVDLTHEGESCTEFAEAAAQLDEEISEFRGGEDPVEPLNASDEVEQSEGSADVCTLETETSVQNSEELDVEIDLAAGDSIEQEVVLESKDEIAADDDAESCEIVEQELKELCPDSVQDFNVAIVKLTELRLQQDVEVVADDTKEPNSVLKETESDVMADDNAVTSENNSPSKPQQQVLPGAELHTAAIISDYKENIGSVTEPVIKKERNSKTGKDGSGVSLNKLSLRKLTKMFKELCPDSVQDFNVAIVKLTELRLQQDVEVVADDTKEANSVLKETESDVMADDNAVTSENNSPSKPQQQVLSGAELHTAAIISDYKENIGSVTELVIKKERNSKTGKDGSGVSLNKLSLRKLTKMFKEQLEITKKSSNELSGGELPRVALQPKN